LHVHSPPFLAACFTACAIVPLFAALCNEKTHALPAERFAAHAEIRRKNPGLLKAGTVKEESSHEVFLFIIIYAAEA